ncbi:MAG: hypothetical protein RDU20_00060 [Desulfomonilaceae bacterium]|nr:hypothetical protein [Desulfomonilaceae bacterium]
MKVALKFCGGCDPAYDRVEYWERIRGAAGDGITWTTADSGIHDAVLLICGCAKTCPRDDMLPDEIVVVLKDDTLDPADVVSRLESRFRHRLIPASEPSEKGVSPS